jgi:hypothetical protein
LVIMKFIYSANDRSICLSVISLAKNSIRTFLSVMYSWLDCSRTILYKVFPLDRILCLLLMISAGLTKSSKI